MKKPDGRIIITGRRHNDSINASKLNFSVKDVVQIVIWVLSLATAWYGVQGKLSEIQTSIKIIATQMEGDTKLNEKDSASRDARIREIEVTMKAYDIRIRQLETDNARRGGR